jgi:peroxiredoxin Q/BCP
MLKIGLKAPDFKLKDQENNTHSLSNYKGNWVVLYFYPKDNTPGCSKEACSFRDNLEELKKEEVVVLGVSADSVNSHQKFAEKYKLNFPILSDENKEIIKKYKARGKKKFMGKTYEGILRITYLINKQGKIFKVYPNVSPENHALEILKDIKNI